MQEPKKKKNRDDYRLKKRIAIIILTLLIFITSYVHADSEVQFNSIPWLSDENVVFENLKSLGFLTVDRLPQFTKEKINYFVYNEVLEYQPTKLSKYEEVANSISIQSMVKGRVGGFPIKDLILTFAYDGTYKLVSINVELVGASYDTLKEKLERVYGLGNSILVEEEGIESTVWKGKDQTGILLYTESDGADYTLLYGRLDAEEIFEQCLTYDLSDISGL